MKQNVKIRFFTLVELLIVISALFLLMSLLSPSLRKMVSKAESLECLNNFKSIGVANSYYLNDFDSKFISKYFGYADVNYFLRNTVSPVRNQSGEYRGTLNIGYKPIYDHLYTNNIDTYLCPTIKVDYIQNALASTWNPEVSLARVRAGAARMNIHLFFNDQTPISSPSEAIFAMDSQSGRKDRNGDLNVGFFAYKLGRKMYEISIRHDYRTNGIFLDGHAESLEATELFNNPQYIAINPEGVDLFKRKSEWHDIQNFNYE